MVVLVFVAVVVVSVVVVEFKDVELALYFSGFLAFGQKGAG